MSKQSNFSNAPTHRETRNGWIFLAFSMLAMPLALGMVNTLLDSPLPEAMLNFVYYCINFAGTVLIFRNYLSDALRVGSRRLFPVVWYALLGYLGSNALGSILLRLTVILLPQYVNVNDLSLILMIREEPLLAIAVVLLVPVAEECIYRGLIFRNLYSKSALAAYFVSMAAFSAIHVLGYLDVLTPQQILASFLQYLPAGYCLAWCYRQTGTILTPILMHMIVNAMSLYSMMR